MKKYYSFLGLAFLVLSFGLNAQTIKNIHRHNLPVLHIPIDLIDKVETVEIGGQKHLQVHQFNGFVNDVLVSQIDSIKHSEGEAIDPAQLGNLRTASVMGIVRGPTGAAEMNAIVRSPYGGEETRTDQNGVFFLNNIVVYDKLGYITIEKPGFHAGSRSFLPLAQGSNRVNIQLLPMTLSGSFSSASGGQVTSGLMQLNFPANAIVQNGQTYTGTVNVYAQALDPSSSEFFDQMPGDLLGAMNGTLRLMRSFGMATVELRDANMQLLQLQEGSQVSMQFTIPATLLSEAPETIDWWSFDEVLGFWEQVGTAQKQGNIYTGYASHFSWWNCDVPANFNDFQGVVNSTDGSPISDALVNVVSSTMGTGFSYTNALGEFSGRVPKNQALTLNIKLFCSTTNTWVIAHTENFSSGVDSIFGLYTTELLSFYPIIGTVVNCEGQPVQSGYVKMGSQISITNQGDFTLLTCQTGEFSFRGFDICNLDSIKVSEMITVQIGSSGVDAGNVLTCSNMFGSVSDIDGNEYRTILIGNQWWMAENLKTDHFSDGSIIPNVIDNTAWVQLSTPARCFYDHILANDFNYGKLYNWYTIADPRNVCPAGWHSPSDAEWTILTDFLGGLSVAGGKIKTTITWQPANTGATNESGLSCLPGGSRYFNNGTFTNLGYGGNWWSSSESTLASAWDISLYYSSDNVGRISRDKRNGFSVRCVKD